jgi:arsenite methyltransferase
MDQDTPSVTDSVRATYGELARRVTAGEATGCCGTIEPCGCGCTTDQISDDLYSADETAAVPETAVRASFGCGNPTALATLREGEVVLDLGSGGGIDVLLSAQRVGPTGKAYGLDMTGDMLSLARANAARAGATNVEFLEGQIEAVPLSDASVDVVISNCVINLSADKGQVIREAYRVLRPGGRFAVSDVVVRGELPAAMRESTALWVGCIAGALHEREFLALLGDAGFVDASIEPTRIYAFEHLGPEVSGQIMGAFVRARKPA